MGPLSTLLKIQELEIVLQESAIVHQGQEFDTESLQKEIEALESQIPEKMLTRYKRVKKNGLGIAQLSHKFPLSTVQFCAISVVSKLIA